MVTEISQFVQNLNNSLSSTSGRTLSKKQQRFVEGCIWAIVWCGRLSWAAFGRFFLDFSPQSLSYMLHKSAIPWEALYKAAVVYALKQFEVKKVFVAVDDTQRPRSSRVSKIFAIFRDYNRKTGGFGIFQNVVMVCLITDKITIPLSFAFYRPDPALALWKKQKKEAKKKKLPQPRKPAPNPKYPTRNEVAMRLVLSAISFVQDVEIAGEDSRTVRVQAVLADAAYFSSKNVARLKASFPKIPMISQIRSNQIVSDNRGKPHPVQVYFSPLTPVKKLFSLRKGLDKNVEFISARLFVKCHGCKHHVVAIRYDGEHSYRYLVCSDLTWRNEDIIKAYAFRWLQEVCFEDWKLYDGWGKAASQQGKDGAHRGVFLSFLVETFLVTHPSQLRLHRSGTGLYTSGTIVRQTQVDTLKWLVYEASKSSDPKSFLSSFRSAFTDLACFKISTKHMSGWDFEELGPAPSLQRQPKYRQDVA